MTHDAQIVAIDEIISHCLVYCGKNAYLCTLKQI